MRKQRAFKDLAEEEIDQIANSLRTETYETVLERIRKPRPEGFGLTISRKPLELLHAKKNTVDKINAKISSGEKLSITEFEDIVDGERADLSDRLHKAILETACELVTSEENTPTRLLALQRLADFPERSELRAAKEERQCEQHLWKSEMHAHKVQMHVHRKNIAEERLALAKRSFDLRERLSLESKKTSTFVPRTSHLPEGHYFDANGRQCDHLGPLPKDINDGEAIAARARKKFRIEKVGTTSMSSLNKEAPIDSGAPPDCPDRAAPDHVAASLQGPPPPAEIPRDLINTDVHPETKSEHSGSTPSGNQSNPTSQSSVSDRIPASPVSATNSTPLAQFSPVQDEKRKAPDSTSTADLRPSDLVVSHAIRRWRAHIRRPEGTPEPDGSWRNECPCGKPLPCADHPELHTRVKYYRPQHPDFPLALKEAGVPYYIPTAEELGCSQQELDKSRDPFGYMNKIPGAYDPRSDPFQNLMVGPALQGYKDRLPELSKW